MKPEIQTIFTEGQVLLIDKPLEWTSHDVVAKVRNTILRLGSCLTNQIINQPTSTN